MGEFHLRPAVEQRDNRTQDNFHAASFIKRTCDAKIFFRAGLQFEIIAVADRIPAFQHLSRGQQRAHNRLIGSVDEF